MGKLRVDISMSLDGFVAGPNQLHVVPVLLGSGARLFENHLDAGQREIECTRVVQSPTGVTHLRYRVVK